MFRLTIRPSQTWLLALFTILVTVPNGAITNFASILIAGLGYDTQNALLLQAPANVIAGISIFTTLWLGDKMRRRIFAGMLCYLVATIGLLILWLLPRSNVVGRLLGTYLIYVFPSGVALVMSLIASNTAGSTKKSTVLGIVLVSYCIGNLIGPQVFIATEAPVYSTALVVILACFIAAGLTLGALWYLLARENKRKEAICTAEGYVVSSYAMKDDLTDRQNNAFRYTL